MITEEYQESVEDQPFLYLSVDLPAPPLFRDELKESIIPQVPLSQILQKFDGVTEREYKTYKDNFLKRYEILRLPKYLIMCFRVNNRLILFISFIFLFKRGLQRIHFIWKRIQQLSTFLLSKLLLIRKIT